MEEQDTATLRSPLQLPLSTIADHTGMEEDDPG